MYFDKGTLAEGAKGILPYLSNVAAVVPYRRQVRLSMEIGIINQAEVRILECLSPITGIDDALDIVAACGEKDSDHLLLESHMLPDSFFDLRTRFAGEFLQKLQNYRVRTAGVFPPKPEYSERFKEFLVEARRGQMFRVFTTRAEALDWLAAE